MTEDKIDRLLSILFWIFVAITVILVLWKVFGSSPATDQILAGLAPALFMEFLRLERKVAKHGEAINHINRKLDEIKSLIEGTNKK